MSSLNFRKMLTLFSTLSFILLSPAYAQDKTSFDQLSSQAWSLFQQKQFSSAALAYGQIVSLLEQRPGDQSKILTRALQLQSVSLLQSNQTDAAIPVLKKLMNTAKKSNDPATEGIAANNLGSLLVGRNQFKQAEQPLKIAAARYKQTEGADSPHYAGALDNLARVYKNTGNLAAAEENAKTAYRIFFAQLGPNNNSTQIARSNLADI